MRENAEDLLLSGLARGDPEAWAHVVERYTGRLLAFARRQLGRHSAEAEDLVQEAFLVLVSERLRLKEIRSLEAFLFQILRRKVIDFRRRKKAESLTDSHWRKIALHSQKTPSSVVSAAEQESKNRRAFIEALARYLEEVKRRSLVELSALELLFVAGRSGNETARRLGLTPVQVSRIKHACLRRLRQELQGRQGFTDSAIGELWKDNMLTCLKRSILGAYELGILESQAADYVKIHLEDSACPYCRANLEDMRAQSLSLPELKAKILATSTPFLARPLEGGSPGKNSDPP